ncbi:MAG: SDR family NAD(P)-dependent oxidoreductase, partial [Candidatus Marinimicrobia bacterium]|nr:SDR family NAD(P)-dependent oxidoreductase [Candidatus Neomarinimicrobiota bacterium]
MNKIFRNRVVIITGSSRGIGKELANQVLSSGGKVVINSRTEATLNALADKLSKKFNDSNILAFVGDISQKEQARNLIERTVDRFGTINILINNAGLINYGCIGMFEPDSAKKVIDVNIYGVVFPTWYALPYIRESRGSIQIVSSLAGIHGLPKYAPYSLS